MSHGDVFCIFDEPLEREEKILFFERKMNEEDLQWVTMAKKCL
jgi:hypothetical protein